MAPVQDSPASMVVLPRADLERLLRDLRDQARDLGYWSKSYREVAPALAASLAATAATLEPRIAWLEQQLAATKSASGSGLPH